jgi:hypothetical protein
MPFQDNPACPRCGDGSVVRVLYGVPDFNDAALMRAKQEGRVVFGGGHPEKRAHDFLCRACVYQWVNGES